MIALSIEICIDICLLDSLIDRNSPINDICMVIIYIRNVYIGSILGLCYSCITVCSWLILRLGVFIRGSIFAHRWRVFTVGLREQYLLIGGFSWLAAFIPTVMVGLIRFHIDLVRASCTHACCFTARLLGLLCLNNIGCRDNHLIIVDYLMVFG